MSQVPALSGDQPLQTHFDIPDLTLKFIVLTGMVLAIVGILAAAGVVGLGMCTPYWYCFEIAALACFVFCCTVCCKSKTHATDSAPPPVYQAPPQQTFTPVPPPQTTAYVQPQVVVDPNQLFLSGLKFVYLQKNFAQALPLFQQAWQMGYLLAGLAICDITKPDLHFSLQVYDLLAKQQCLEALYLFAYEALEMNKGKDAVVLLLNAQDVEQNADRKKILEQLLLQVKSFAMLSDNDQLVHAVGFKATAMDAAKKLLGSTNHERHAYWLHLAQTN